jgi:hypothetical protein
MQRVARTVGVLMAGALAPLLAAVPAYAGGATHAKAKVLQANWYWAKQTDALAAETAGTPLSGKSEPSGVPAGDLAVAYVNGSDPNKETYLAFDESELTADSKVTSFSFTLALDPNTPQVQTSPPALIACLPTRPWSNGQGDDVANKPYDDCTHFAKGAFDAKAQTYTFTVTRYAQRWVDDVNTGVAIRESKDTTTPFQLAFSGPKTVKASLAYILTATKPSQGGKQPTGSTGQTPQTPQQPVSPPAYQPVDGGSSVADLSGGLSSGSTTTPSTPTSNPGQSPEVAAGGTTPPTTTTAAGIPRVRPAGSLPGTGFWIAAAALVLLLGVIYATVSEAEVVPAGTPRRPSRLDEVLRRRRTTRAAGLTALSSNPATRS